MLLLGGIVPNVWSNFGRRIWALQLRSATARRSIAGGAIVLGVIREVSAEMAYASARYFEAIDKVGQRRWIPGDCNHGYTTAPLWG